MHKVMVLHPVDVSALNLRAWLNRELEGVTEDTLVRLFLLERTRFAFTPKKLDALLNSVVDRHPCVVGISVTVVKEPLTMEELGEVVIAVSPTEGLRRFVGYREEEVLCLVSNIVMANRGPVSEQSGIPFALGDWFVSVGAHENVRIYGPFDMDAAMKTATNLGATRIVAV